MKGKTGLAFSALFTMLILSSSVFHSVMISSLSHSVGNTGFESWYYYIGGMVNSATGNLYFTVRDVSFKAKGFDIEVVRAYNSHCNGTGTGFGYGWTFNYHLYLEEYAGYVSFVEGDGSVHNFTDIGGGRYSPPPGVHSRLIKNVDGSFTLWFKDGSKYNFNSTGMLLNIVDKNDNHLTFSYTDGRLTRVEDDSGLALMLSYDMQNRIRSVADPLNRQISYEYDAYSNLIKVIDAMGYFRLYFYDGNHSLKSVVNRIGGLLEFGYSYGRVVEMWTGLYDYSLQLPSLSFTACSIEYGVQNVVVTDALGHKTSIELNEFGNPIKITEPLDRIWTTSWDNDMAMISSTDANSHTYNYEYNAYGNLINQADPLDYSTLYEWENIDTDARYISLHKSTTNALGYKTSFDYDEKGNLIKTTNAKGNSSYNYYNDYGYVNRTVDFRGYETLYSFDAHGHMVSSTDAMGNVTKYNYDLVGSLISTINPLNDTTTIVYDANDRVIKITDALGNETIYNYNAVGSLIKITDAKTYETSYSHNIIGKADKTTDASNNETSFSFDKSGNLIETTDAKGNKITTVYDALGRVISVTDALGNTESYTYDAVGNTLSKTDKNNNITTYEYDEMNRLILTSYPDGSSVAATYDAEGNIIQVTSTSGLGDTTYYSYDELNRLVSMTIDYGSFAKTINYTYDANSNRKTMTDPDGGITTYEYDPVNQLLSITNPSNDVTTYEYDNAGIRIEMKYPNGIITTYTYDAINSLLNLENAKSNAEVISSHSYSYDNVGNKLSLTDTNGNVTFYKYDSMYRLINVTYPDGTTTQYTYDSVGNRLTQAVDEIITAYTYDAGNRLLSADTINYSYDNNGNLISKTDASGTTTYEYDHKNRLTGVTLPDTSSVTCRYSPFGKRLSKTTSDGTTYYLYDNEDILMELNETGMLKARYTHGSRIDGPISMDRSGVVFYYHFDGLGSVTLLTNTAENVVVTYQYDAFGAVKEETGTVENPYKFTSREYDEESGLYYYRARYYDSHVGRFIGRDPIGYMGLYIYCGNNPINFLDPYGLYWPWEKEFWKGVGKQVSAISGFWGDVASDVASGKIPDVVCEPTPGAGATQVREAAGETAMRVYQTGLLGALAAEVGIACIGDPELAAYLLDLALSIWGKGEPLPMPPVKEPHPPAPREAPPEPKLKSVITPSGGGDSTGSIDFIRDVAITSLTADESTIYVGITNLGECKVTTSVTVYTEYIIDPPVTLLPGASTTVTFSWTPPTYGRYEIRAEASIVPGEEDTADNTLTITIRIVGALLDGFLCVL